MRYFPLLLDIDFLYRKCIALLSIIYPREVYFNSRLKQIHSLWKLVSYDKWNWCEKVAEKWMGVPTQHVISHFDVSKEINKITKGETFAIWKRTNIICLCDYSYSFMWNIITRSVKRIWDRWLISGLIYLYNSFLFLINLCYIFIWKLILKNSLLITPSGGGVS